MAKIFWVIEAGIREGVCFEGEAEYLLVRLYTVIKKENE